jgi:hypothetical protein
MMPITSMLEDLFVHYVSMVDSSIPFFCSKDLSHGLCKETSWSSITSSFEVDLTELPFLGVLGLLNVKAKVSNLHHMGH